MSYWIEVRCTIMGPNGCYSARQVDTPMERTRNASMSAINSTIFNLTKEAKELGWKYTDKGWVCPKCSLLK